MGRTIDSAMVTALESTEGYADIWFLLIKSADADGTNVVSTYYTTAPVDVAWDGQTWEGIGGVIEIEAPPETDDHSGQSCRLSLAGCDRTIITKILTKAVRGREASLWWGQINIATGTVAESSAGEGPLKVFSGFMNSAWEISVQPSDETTRGDVRVSTTVVSRMARYLFARSLRTNVLSHQEFLERGDILDTSNPDVFFRFIPDQIGKPLYWGFKGTSNPYRGVRLTPRPNFPDERFHR